MLEVFSQLDLTTNCLCFIYFDKCFLHLAGAEISKELMSLYYKPDFKAGLNMPSSVNIVFLKKNLFTKH